MFGIKRLIVPEAFAGLLYRNGSFVRVLEPGAYWFWKFRTGITLIDLRQRALTVAGQDVLTEDNVGVKVTLATRFRVADPATATHTVQDFNAALYQVLQLALRAVVGAVGAEALISERLQISAKLSEIAEAELTEIGLALDKIDVKDVMFPGQVKRSFSDIIQARNEGLAALEKARGESAALRNLANAARMLEQNPNLLRLRFLRTLDEAGAGYGNTLVLGVPEDFALLNANKKN